MGFFNSVSGAGALSGAVQTTVGGIQNVAGIASNVGTALGLPTGNILGALRSAGLPIGGELMGSLMGTVTFASGENAANDWRLRLSLPNLSSFRGSPVLYPLQAAGGMVFPYTPQVTIKSNAKYSNVAPIHTNYPFAAYQNSDPGTIEITTDWYVEDATQAQYWVAAVHYLRSVTKMFTGDDSLAGNPPPIVFLNGYGQYVFKQVPVVVTQMSITLPKEVDYVPCELIGNQAGGVNSLIGAIGGIAGIAGGFSPKIAKITNTVGAIAGTASAIGLFGSTGIGGMVPDGTGRAPTKSTFTITLQPAYSRETVRTFSLDRFVSGGYVNSSYGHV